MQSKVLLSVIKGGRVRPPPPLPKIVLMPWIIFTKNILMLIVFLFSLYVIIDFSCCCCSRFYYHLQLSCLFQGFWYCNCWCIRTWIFFIFSWSLQYECKDSLQAESWQARFHPVFLVFNIFKKSFKQVYTLNDGNKLGINIIPHVTSEWEQKVVVSCQDHTLC